MAGLTDNDALVSSDGLVAHSLTDATTDPSGIHPAAGSSSEQFRMITGLLTANTVAPRDSVFPLANRLLTAAISYYYRGQSSLSGPFVPQHLVGVRHNFTLSNGDIVTPGDAYRIAPSQGLEPDTDTDSANRAFADAFDAFNFGWLRMKEGAWQKALQATDRQIQASMHYNGYGYTPGAVPVITRFEPDDLIRMFPAYVGHQIPSRWVAYNYTTSISNTISLLSDSQSAWNNTMAGRVQGLFVPVYYFDSEWSAPYGTANTFGWNGPIDTHGMLDQLNAMRDMADIAGRLDDAGLKSRATEVAVNALKWFANDRCWIPSNPGIADAWSASIRKSAALDYDEGDIVSLPELWFTVPNRLSTTSYPTPQYEPGLLALAMHSAIMVDRLQRPDNATGPMSTEVARVMEKCIQMFDFTYIEEGIMAGTFSPDPANLKWQSRWHAELLIAMTGLYNWCGQPNNQYGKTRAKALKWIKGLLDSAEGLSADQTGGFIYGRAMWPLEPDWSDGITETFEYSTQLITADSGKEQRLARRTKPRRGLSMRHTLTTADEAAQYQAILRKRQWRPMLVPQWHMASQVGTAAKIGDTQLTLDQNAPPAWSTAKALYLVAGDNKQLLNVTRVSGAVVTLRESLPFDVPRGSELMTVQYGLIDNNLSSSRAISTVLQAQVAFRILPQTDTRVIPEIVSYNNLIIFISEQGHRWAKYIRRAAALDPAVWPTWPEMQSNYTTRMSFTVNGDTRMVITRKPNWKTEVSLVDEWMYDVIDYVNSAITPGYAENAGRRTFQAMWTAFNYDEVDDILSVLGALRGAQVACWIPSWSHDLTVASDMTAKNRLRVEQNAIIDEGILTGDPSIALMIETRQGAMECAAVSSVTTSAGISTLTLDRELVSLLTKEDIMKVSLMYRVRQATDTVELKWHVKGIAELQASFITVQE